MDEGDIAFRPLAFAGGIFYGLAWMVTAGARSGGLPSISRLVLWAAQIRIAKRGYFPCRNIR